MTTAMLIELDVPFPILAAEGILPNPEVVLKVAYALVNGEIWFTPLGHHPNSIFGGRDIVKAISENAGVKWDNHLFFDVHTRTGYPFGDRRDDEKIFYVEELTVTTADEQPHVWREYIHIAPGWWKRRQPLYTPKPLPEWFYDVFRAIIELNPPNPWGPDWEKNLMGGIRTKTA